LLASSFYGDKKINHLLEGNIIIADSKQPKPSFVETLNYGRLKLSFAEIDLKVIWERSVKKTSFSEVKN